MLDRRNRGLIEGVFAGLRDGHDLAALAACARGLKGASPSYAQEHEVLVTASPDVPYAEVIAVTDALRGDADGPLFPEPRFGEER